MNHFDDCGRRLDDPEDEGKMKRYQVWQQQPDTKDSVQTTGDRSEAIRLADELARPGNHAFVIDTTTHEKIYTRYRDIDGVGWRSGPHGRRF